MIISISRRAHFNSAHKLEVKSWSPEKNRQVFGPCNNPGFHGHNYEFIVTLTGELDPESGILMDLKELKQIMREEVEYKFDHRNLNLDTEEFRELNPTAENIAVVIWNLMRKRIRPDLKIKVTLFETERNSVEYEGA